MNRIAAFDTTYPRYVTLEWPLSMHAVIQITHTTLHYLLKSISLHLSQSEINYYNHATKSIITQQIISVIGTDLVTLA